MVTKKTDDDAEDTETVVRANDRVIDTAGDDTPAAADDTTNDDYEYARQRFESASNAHVRNVWASLMRRFSSSA